MDFQWSTVELLKVEALPFRNGRFEIKGDLDPSTLKDPRTLYFDRNTNTDRPNKSTYAKTFIIGEVSR